MIIIINWLKWLVTINRFIWGLNDDIYNKWLIIVRKRIIHFMETFKEWIKQGLHGLLKWFQKNEVA